MDLVFNNIDFSRFCTVEQIRRSIFPPRIIKKHKIPGKIGEYFIGVDMGPGRIEVDIRIIEKNRIEVQETVRNLARILNTNEPTNLYLRDEPTKFNIAILSEETNIEKFVNTGFCTLVFECLDPLAYSINENKIFISSQATNLINNVGSNETTGTIEIDIDSSINNLEILLNETGEKIYIEDNFISGDKIYIDLKEEYVKKNGILINDKLHIITDFFKLPKDLFTIVLSSGTGYLRFREAWI